jgi:hypothetical protein
MVHIQTVDLAMRGVTFPPDRVGMVMAQPYLPDDGLVRRAARVGVDAHSWTQVR